MPINILMPALSPTMEKGNLAKWLKKEGDTVKSGDIIAEIETDKATMEVEAVDEGILAKILISEGTSDVPVNQPIAVIAGEGEDPKSVTGAASGGPAPMAEAAAPPAAAGQRQRHRHRQAAPAPAAAAQAPAAAAKPNGGAGQGGRIFASPLAKRVAKEAGLDLAAIQGSGPHGRIVEKDVKSAVAGGGAKRAAPAAAPAPKAATGDRACQLACRPTRSRPCSRRAPMRKSPSTACARPSPSVSSNPSRRCRISIWRSIANSMPSWPCASRSTRARRRTRTASPPTSSRSTTSSSRHWRLHLQRVPAANSVWADDRILRLKHSDVGVAVAIEGGLFTPVIRKAEQKTLTAISAEMKDLAGRARNRRLKPEEYTGGSTAVSNLGMFGIKDFLAVINPPQGTILAVGAGEKRMVVKNDAPAIVQAMTVTLSCDHRVVDGALGAELLAAFKVLIENPMSMVV